MSKPIIEITNIGKCYKIGAQKEKYLSLRDEVAKFASGRLRMKRQSEQDFWALTGISFNVQEGEAVGIIGSNGAGKSTILKILSQITPPTEGRITLRGRVASLLEVGTGFHPELTGRENIFLNGTILGMTRKEVSRKFDEIVAFSEIDKFLETPVKRYSSGMYVRLAFAVAAHLEPEILVVDEVLSVGDIEFQKKCLEKMGEVATGGTTVLFVSHNMAAIEYLCKKACLLTNGKLSAFDDVGEIVSKYLGLNKSLYNLNFDQRSDRKGDQRIRFRKIEIEDCNGNLIGTVKSGMDVVFVLKFESLLNNPIRKVTFSIALYGSRGEFLFLCDSGISGQSFSILPGVGKISCSLCHFPLTPGQYYVNINCSINEEISDWLAYAAYIVVESGDFYKTGKLPPETHSGFLIENEWRKIE